MGFPGETDEHFAELVDFVEESRFEAVGVFCFSPEPGTPAASLPDPVPADVAEERATELMAVQRELALARNEELIGQAQPLEVLVDGVDADGRCIGRFYGQAPDIDGVCLLTEPAEPGEFVDVTVIGCEDYDLIVG